MKKLLAVVLMSFAGASACGLQAGAMERVSTPASAAVEPPLYTCAGKALSHVAYVAEAAPCCTGRFACPQLLSNTGLIKPKRDNHT